MKDHLFFTAPVSCRQHSLSKKHGVVIANNKKAK